MDRRKFLDVAGRLTAGIGMAAPLVGHASPESLGSNGLMGGSQVKPAGTGTRTDPSPHPEPSPQAAPAESNPSPSAC